MTDYNDHSTLKHDSTSNMKALETAIFDGKEQRLKLLLSNLLFDEIQKSFLINLAIKTGNLKMVELLKEAPASP